MCDPGCSSAGEHVIIAEHVVATHGPPAGGVVVTLRRFDMIPSSLKLQFLELVLRTNLLVRPEGVEWKVAEAFGGNVLPNIVKVISCYSYDVQEVV